VILQCSQIKTKLNVAHCEVHSGLLASVIVNKSLTFAVKAKASDLAMGSV
jgi:hypothetical protein